MSGFFTLYLPFLIYSLVFPILVANNTLLYAKMKKSWSLNEVKHWYNKENVYTMLTYPSAEVWLNPAEVQANMFLKL